jgi:hypothetical protein
VIIHMDALINRKFRVAVLLLALYAAQETRGFSAYLKQIGPSPLRFSLATAIPLSFTLPMSLVEPQKPTNATEIAVSPTISAQTNAVAAVPFSTSATNAQATALSAELPAKPAPTPSASEMLVVSPQMLTEFFKPATEGTNSANAVIVPVTSPVPVGFTPPSVKSPSRATYNTP